MKKQLNTLALAGSLAFLSACSGTHNQLTELNSLQIFRISNGIEAALIAPIGFNLTQEHYGFVQAESFSRIKISEIESPLTNYLSQLTKENLLKNKLQIKNQEEVKVNGATCHLFTLRQNIAGTYYEKKWLIAGDELSTIQVEASYPEGASNSHKQNILKSITSLAVKTDKAHRIYTGLPFKFSDTANFKLTTRFSNSIVFSPLDDKKKQNVTFSHGATKNDIEDIKQLSDHFLKNSKSIKELEILSNEMIKINNIPAFSSTAYAMINEEPVYIYQVVAYQSKRFLLMQGYSIKSGKTEFKAEVDELLKNFEYK